MLSCATKQEKSDSQKGLEQDAALKHSLDEFEAKNKHVILLEKQVKELEQKLELADAKLKEKVSPRPFLSPNTHTHTPTTK